MTIGVLSAVDLGHWRIPHRAQNALIQQHAAQHRCTISFVVSEFVFSTRFENLRALIHDGVDIGQIVFASALQLPPDLDSVLELSTMLGGRTLHFALEGDIISANRTDVLDIHNAAVFFRNARHEEFVALRGQKAP